MTIVCSHKFDAINDSVYRINTAADRATGSSYQKENKMSANHKLVQGQTLLSGHRRILLHCRFDYRQRTWNFPASGPGHEGGVGAAVRPEDSAELLSALSAARVDLADGGR